MGKHDEYAHFMHITKQMKFRPPVPGNAFETKARPPEAPQTPPVKTNAHNQYRGHGKGV